MGRKPNISHMKVFRCIAYACILEQKRTKLDDKNSKLIFIGYNTKFKAYKLFDPNNSKIMISRDVKFNEEDEWSWHNKVGQIVGEEPAQIEVEKSSSAATLSSTRIPSSTPSSSTLSDSSSD